MYCIEGGHSALCASQMKNVTLSDLTVQPWVHRHADPVSSTGFKCDECSSLHYSSRTWVSHPFHPLNNKIIIFHLILLSISLNLRLLCFLYILSRTVVTLYTSIQSSLRLLCSKSSVLPNVSS